jgi:hypothetical protein
MVDFFDKIVKFFTKLDNYAILSREKEHLIVSVPITITVYDDETANPFIAKSLDTSLKQKTFNVHFLITIAERATELDKLFLKHKLPLLSLNNKKGTNSLKEFKVLLDNFVENNFYNKN